MLPKIIFYIKIVKYCVKELIIWQPNKKSQFSKCRRLSEKKFKHTIFTGTTVQYYTFKSFSLLYLPFSAKCTINIYTKCLLYCPIQWRTYFQPKLRAFRCFSHFVWQIYLCVKIACHFPCLNDDLKNSKRQNDEICCTLL